MKTVQAHELSHISMVAGNESKFSRVIDYGIVKEWVGIGWVELHPATAEDKEKYPTVVGHG